MRTLTGTLQTAQDASPHKAYVEATVTDDILHFASFKTAALPAATATAREDHYVAGDGSIISVWATKPTATTLDIWVRRVTAPETLAQWDSWSRVVTAAALDSTSTVGVSVSGSGSNVYIFYHIMSSTSQDEVWMLSSANNGASFGATALQFSNFDGLGRYNGLNQHIASWSNEFVIFLDDMANAGRTLKIAKYSGAWTQSVVPVSPSLFTFFDVEKIGNNYNILMLNTTTPLPLGVLSTIHDGVNWSQFETTVPNDSNTSPFGHSLHYVGDTFYSVGYFQAAGGTGLHTLLRSTDFIHFRNVPIFASPSASPEHFFKLVQSTHWYAVSSKYIYKAATSLTLNISSDVERYQAQPHPDTPVSEAITLEVANE